MTSYEIISGIIEKARGSESLKKEIAGLDKSFQFKPSDASPFYVQISNGDVVVKEGALPAASATISPTEQVLSDIMGGKLDAMGAFMKGQLKVSGDIFIAQKLTGIVSKNRK